MARVASRAQQVLEFTGGLDHFEIQAGTVRALILELDRLYPGLGTHVDRHMAIAIDGEIHQDALGEPLGADSEVVLIPRIGGG
ncbi:MAG TPA: MoaD/ThiS family protein [Burkholderiaceae bacterium]|jgi:molybdopterin converting factor small subunit|nr:MoaD/ThiS family protein [Burkholderiaceae bacterium]